MELIRNKVAESGIITLDLATFIPAQESIAQFDLLPLLFHGMILREKDYRAALQTQDWSSFAGKDVALFCSTDAIIPVWAYMLAAAYLAPVAQSVHWAKPDEAAKEISLQKIQEIDAAAYQDKRVILKGCGDVPVPEWAYVAATLKLQPVVRSLMYGEPCSTVPVYKKPMSAAREL